MCVEYKKSCKLMKYIIKFRVEDGRVRSRVFVFVNCIKMV